MSDLFERFPKEMDEWKKQGEGARFFGRPTFEMDRDELLALVGFMGESAEKQRERFDEYMNVFSQIRNFKAGAASR